jgi:23S rRNA (cytidine1920-2'-O)/16S rRNA (cytidine1409-2'-O)-methyltransferase
MTRRRLDAELVHRGLARSREQAQTFIEEGRVRLNGTVAAKSATQVDNTSSIVVSEAETGPDYVSRGAHKLTGALDAFGVDVRDRWALDAGASTGGFCDVLLRRGIAGVIAVDVGYGQLAWPIRSDERVVIMERTNVRELVPDAVPYRPDLIVADLSFISLATVLPALRSVGTDDADFLLMVKPQFEVGKERVGSGGVVRDPVLRSVAVRKIADVAVELGLGTAGVVASPLPGPSGNVEYFLHLRHGAEPLTEVDLQRAIQEGPQ